MLVRDCRFSIEHDGNSIAVYASPAAAGAYRSGVYPFADGTILVKPEYSDAACSDLVRTSAMRKTGGVWEWQRLDLERQVIAGDGPETCVRCHSGCTEGRDLACTDP